MWVCRNRKCRAENFDNYANYCYKCGTPRNGDTKPRPALFFAVIGCCLLVIAVLIIWIIHLSNDNRSQSTTSAAYTQAQVPAVSWTPTQINTPTPVQINTPTPSPARTYVWSEWSAWSSNPVSSSSAREVETRQNRTVIGYNMVHYGTQQAAEPHYRMFRDYSINGNYERFGARESYTEKHLTKYVTAAQMSTATSYPANGALINLRYNGEDYGGFQMGTTTAYNFGDDNKVWFIESEQYTITTEYRHRDLVVQ